MAEYILKADTDVIRSTTDSISTQKNNMEGYMRDMQSKVNELQNYFISDAGREFVNKYSTVTQNIQNCLNNLQTEITGLRNAASILDTDNSAITSNVNALSGDNVFPNS
jgi:uncharacterized protein YukE